MTHSVGCRSALLLGPSLPGEGREGLGCEGWQTKAVFSRAGVSSSRAVVPST